MGDMSREPSMEDILSSIRRVIARDEAPGATRDGRAVEAEDILDLQDQEDRAAASPVEDAPEAGELVSEASADAARRSEEHTSELQSLMRISYAVFYLKKKNKDKNQITIANNYHEFAYYSSDAD